MNRRPPKQAGNCAIFGVNVHALGWCDLVVTSAIATQIDEAITGDVVHKPTDFIGVRFNDHFVRSLWIDDTYNGSICIDELGVDVRLDVVEPQLLTLRFEARGRRIVQVSLQKFLGLRRDDFLFCHVSKLPRGSFASCQTAPAVVHREG